MSSYKELKKKAQENNNFSDKFQKIIENIPSIEPGTLTEDIYGAKAIVSADLGEILGDFQPEAGYSISFDVRLMEDNSIMVSVTDSEKAWSQKIDCGKINEIDERDLENKIDDALEVLVTEWKKIMEE